MKRKAILREVTFERTGDEVWLELECGHCVRKVPHSRTNAYRRGVKEEPGANCAACAAMENLN